MVKKKLLMAAVLGLLTAACMAGTAQAAAFSDCWKQDNNGSWYVEKADGGRVTNAWLCDDAPAENGKDVWYLLGADGNLITAGLVKDGNGNYYSLETGHDGNHGMLRAKSGYYDGMYLEVEENHNGSYAKLLDESDIQALSEKYGVFDISFIDSSNCVYTSSLTGKNTAAVGGSTREERLKYMELYYGHLGMTEAEKQAKMQEIIFGMNRAYSDPEHHPITMKAWEEFLTSIDWPNMSEYDRAKAAFMRVRRDHDGRYYDWSTLEESYSGEDPVLAFNHGICGDYSLSMARLCEMMGLEAHSVGCLYFNWAHGVTLMKIDNEWYIADPTNATSSFEDSLHPLYDEFLKTNVLLDNYDLRMMGHPELMREWNAGF